MTGSSSPTIQPGIPSARLAASRQHDREVAAKALRDAAHDIHQRFSDQEYAEDLLTDRAILIERGEVAL